MPIYSAPTNDNDRSGFLKAAFSAASNDEVAGNTYILPNTRETLTTFYSAFEHKTATINQKLQVRSKESAESGEARHSWRAVISQSPPRPSRSASTAAQSAPRRRYLCVS